MPAEDTVIEEFVKDGATWVWKAAVDRHNKQLPMLNRFDAETAKNSLLQERGPAAIGHIRTRKVG